MINFKVYNKEGTLQYEVSSKSSYCLEKYHHVAIGQNRKKLAFKYDNTIHNLVQGPTDISNETQLYDYLYSSNEGYGILKNDISLSGTFFSDHKTHNYPTISAEKTLSGNFSIFPNTTAYTSSADKYIFKSYRPLTLQNLTISGFTNPYLNIVDVSSSELTISGCIFSNNDVGVNINVDYSHNTTHIINSTFKSLKANKLIPTPNESSTFKSLKANKLIPVPDESSTFKSLKANKLKANGPRLVQSNKKVKINRRNNGQTNDTTGEEKWSPGSAIRYKGEMLYITDSSFVDNSNSYTGGAIYAETYIKTLTLSGENLFSHNISSLGGAICITDANEIIVNNGMATFNGNISDIGGAILSESPAMSGGGTYIFSDNCANSGGAIFAYDKMTISGGTYTFSDNCANLQDAGAIKATDISITDGSYTFKRNIAKNYGGAINVSNKMTISGGTYTFKGNIAKEEGGGAISTINLITTYGTYTFSDNCANLQDGGAIWTSDISITDGSYTFKGNIANTSGGAIATINLITTGGTYTVSDNCANYGGAINATDISITDGSYTFNSNIAKTFGGAIYAYSMLTIKDGTYTFSDNCANLQDGGVIKATDISITDGSYTFNGNIANTYGGAINTTNLITTGGTYTVSDNCANYGGAINATDISITDGSYTFNSNIAKTFGGAIYSYGTVDISTVKTVRFYGNSSISNSTLGNHIFTKDICYNDSSHVIFNMPDCSGSDGSAVWSRLYGQICPP